VMNGISIALVAALFLTSLAEIGMSEEVHRLVAQGRVEQLRDALGANPSAVNEKDKEGRTPLHSAAAGGNAKVVAVLLEKHADVNARAPDDSTPLHYAAAGGHLSVAELLLAAGADPHRKDKKGFTPVQRAPKRSRAMRELIQKAMGE
ncbi:MAG: ankyrin repeat domain-containing protein, partial [Candidatus Binatia bacterium]